MKSMLVLVFALWALFPCGVGAATLDADTRALLSRVQAMSHGYYAQAEWQEVFARLAALREDARRARNIEKVIELNVVESMIHGEAFMDVDKAVAILEETRREYDASAVSNMTRVYVQLSALYARQGNERAIAALMKEFQASPHYDPVSYPFTGGSGPNDPLWVTRPHARGKDSITLSTMQRYRNQARFPPGRVFPDLTGIDARGQTVRLSDYRGQVVLLDFWVPGFVAWERDVMNLLALHRDYRSRGFEIIGIPQTPTTARAEAVLRQYGIAWPQWRVEDRAVAELGIFGDAHNFLIDRNGVIVGRNLRGSALHEALRPLL